MRQSRRHFLTGLCGCGVLCGSGGLAWAGGVSLPSLLAPAYRPSDSDERGLWMQMEKAEQDLRNSNLRIHDPALNKYLTDLTCEIVGNYCPDVRVYVVRTPYFNASMAPNGMMQIWSGLLLRCRNEAQLAAVIGHEAGHFLRQHGLQQFRSIKSKTALMNVLALPLAVVGGSAAVQLGQLAMIATMFSYSREHEREADQFGLQLLEERGYQPSEASAIWRQLVAERDASFAARGKKTPSEPLIFATHPQSAERMETLAAAAAGITKPGRQYSAGPDRFAAVMKPHRGAFLEDQVKLNDFGGTLYLIDSLKDDGWPGELGYYRGEVYRRRGDPGDLQQAISHYRTALAFPDAPAVTHRSLGYALIKTGDKEAGRQALRQYLALTPDATDRAMVEFSLQ